MSGGADPDPLGSFETGYGSRGTRGIRGGKSAKRKREAYLKWQESEGQDRASVPIVHTGGQARPLYTDRNWQPEDDQSDSEIEVTSDSVAVPDSSILDGVLTAPIPSVLAPRAKSSTSSSASSGRILTLTSKAKAAPPSSASSAGPRPSSAPRLPTASSSRPRPSSAPAEAVRRFANLHESVELFVPDSEQWDKKVDHFPIRTGGERICAVDWHQVSDSFRTGARYCERLSDQYILPRGVVRAFEELASAKRDGDLIIILSHIHQSEFNKNQLLWSVFVNKLPVDLVVVTKERCGPAGKLFALGALNPYSTENCLVDDNIEIALEFAAFIERFGPHRSKLKFFHVKVPRKPICHDFPSEWNIGLHVDAIKNFLNQGR